MLNHNAKQMLERVLSKPRSRNPKGLRFTRPFNSTTHFALRPSPELTREALTSPRSAPVVAGLVR